MSGFTVVIDRRVEMMKLVMRQLLAQMFSPISRRKALRIASRVIAQEARSATLICHSTTPTACNIYSAPSEPCWYIYTPWNDGKDGMMIRSSRVILVGKLSGAIHYDGSAGDEG